MATSEPILNRPCGGRYGDVVEAVGNTPLVELSKISPKPGVRIFAKLEGRNPTGSVKDRVAKAMIEDAEASGAIGPGQTVFEPTSGNTGISLGMICRRKGYPLKVVMPDNVTEERTQLLQMYGAEIVYSEGAKGSNGAVELALEMAEADSSLYMPYQYGNEANPRAHYEGTAPEILEELDGVAAFVGGLGTGGTLMGLGRRLKEEDPEILLQTKPRLPVHHSMEYDSLCNRGFKLLPSLIPLDLSQLLFYHLIYCSDMAQLLDPIPKHTLSFLTSWSLLLTFLLHVSFQSKNCTF